MKFPVRFSLRNLLLFTVAASILSTVVGMPYAEYRRELVIANKLEERGCWVDWRPRTTNWGADFFSSVGLGNAFLRVNGVEFKEDWDIKNDDLSELSGLTHLAWVSFPDSSVDDDGLLHFRDCNSLTHLEMKDNSSITNVGLRNLNLNDLHFLDIDGTSVTYGGIRWIAMQNPMLDETTLIGRHALGHLKQGDFRYQTSIGTESKLQSRDNITVREDNSRRQWHDAAEHLREFPGVVIYQFQDLPETSGPEVEWGLTLSVVILKDATTIRPSEVEGAVRRGTLPAVAIIPPFGTAVSRLSGEGTIRAWFGEPDWPANVGEDSLEITGAEVVFVDADSLPVTVQLRQHLR